MSDYDFEGKYIPEHERAKIPEEDFAGPGRTFPIRNQQDVEDAAHLIGHAANPNKVRERICEIARRKGLALPESWRSKSIGVDTLVVFGSEVKDFGKGHVGGHLVLFGTPENPDLTRDFFTRETDFGPHKSTMVLYEHGFDPKLKGRILQADAQLGIDDVGVWIDAQLTARDEYEEAILQFIGQKKLGWSSGTASHLVERAPVGKSFHITRWPLGLDASLTPTPAEPRTLAVPLKSLYPELDEGLHDGLTFEAHSTRALAAVKEFIDRAKALSDLRAQDGRRLSAERIAEIKLLHADLEAIIVANTPPPVMPLDYYRRKAEVRETILREHGS